MSVEGKSPPVSPLKRPASLGAQAYEILRRELLAERPLAATERLTEREVAKHLSMSRTPVREALRRLEMAGVLKSVPGGGYVRRRASLREIQDHFELRLLLEPEAAALAARGHPEAAGSLLAAEERDHGPEANSLFHKAVGRLSGNYVLADFIATLIDRLESQRIYARPGGHAEEELTRGHTAVAAAVRAGNPDVAAKEMRDHLLLALDVLRKAWRTQSRVDQVPRDAGREGFE